MVGSVIRIIYFVAYLMPVYDSMWPIFFFVTKPYYRFLINFKVRYIILLMINVPDIVNVWNILSITYRYIMIINIIIVNVKYFLDMWWTLFR